MQTRYPSSIREEELKNKAAADFFGAFDCAHKALAAQIAPKVCE